MIITAPVVIIGLLIALLYIPPIQRAVVDKACREIAAQSGYDIAIGSIALSFPLKLQAVDFTMSKNDSIYFRGRGLDANISLTPLFTGKVEVNFVALEDLEMNTYSMLPEMNIAGKVGFAQVVTRYADLANAVADIRQLIIADSDIRITMADTTIVDDDEPLEWIIKLNRGRIRNSRIAFSVPHDTLEATAYIGGLRLGRGSADIAKTQFALRGIALKDTRIEYDRGSASATEAPLDHIRIEDIAIKARDLQYAGINDISADITRLTLHQPSGITVTEAAMRCTSSNDTLRLHRLWMESRNGSYISGEATIPHKALENPKKEKMTGAFRAAVIKPDLAGLITPQLYGELHWFNERMIDASLAFSGNITKLDIDALSLDFPGLGTVSADGYIKEILEMTKCESRIAFNAGINDIKRFTGAANDTIDGRTTAGGHISYNSGEIAADVALHNASGEITAIGSYNMADTTYTAQVEIERLALAEIMPDIPLHSLKMHVNAKGQGTDIFSKAMRYDINATIDTLDYDRYRLRSIEARMSQNRNISSISIDGHDSNLLFGIDAKTRLRATGIANHTVIELKNADLEAIGAVDSALSISTSIDLAVTSNFRESHSLKIKGESTVIEMMQNRFTPGSLAFEFATTPRRTEIKALNGDLKIDGEMDCGYKRLFTAMNGIARMNRNMLEGKRALPHLHDYLEGMPDISLYFDCGEQNILHNALGFMGIETNGMKLKADISHQRGVDISGNMIGFGASGVRLDSIGLYTRQKDESLNYMIMANGIAVTSAPKANSHNALFYGSLKCDTITSNLLLRNNIDKTDSKAGIITLLSPGNLDTRFVPEALLFGEPFSFGNNSYINIGKKMSIDADVTFTGHDDSGFKLYTTPDENAVYDISLDIFNISLSDIVNTIPVLPDMEGTLFSRLNYRKESIGDIFTGSIELEKFSCNKHTIGNEKFEFAYSPKSDDVHDVSCTLKHNGKEVARVNSDYQRGALNGGIALNSLPLSITQAFIDKEGVMLEGYLDGKLDFKGTLTEMKSNGYLRLDTTYIYSPMLGAALHPSDDMIMIENSRINLQQYHIYDKVNTPFIINGSVDIKNLLDPKLSLRLNASNYEVLNTPRKAGKMVYGKMYVDLHSMLRGTLNDMRMSGDLTILSNSDFAYILPEKAFDSSKELEGLVEFVNFNDTSNVELQEPEPIDLGDITANLNIKVNEGAKLSIDLDSSRENYVSIEGDANLNASYDNHSGFNVTGIYKLNSGEVKLTLPIIPLRTFYIQEGSSLTWTGDMFSPTLNVTAMEKTTVSVEMDDNSIQPVEFYAGVTVSNNVNNLAVDFTMSAPDNSVIQGQLNELDRETLSRYAVAMIITGSYLGSRQGVTATSALSSFLDAKINQISGSAIKDFDVNIGINDAMNAETGNAYTNYSFSFSKRFLNDRITVVIGGEVNSGDRPDKSAGNETFINNISLEWKLNQAGNRYIRIFYDKNYQSLLEGEITETGVGYVYKRKLSRLRDLFVFRRKAKQQPAEQPQKRRDRE